MTNYKTEQARRREYMRAYQAARRKSKSVTSLTVELLPAEYRLFQLLAESSNYPREQIARLALMRGMKFLANSGIRRGRKWTARRIADVLAYEEAK